MTKVYVRKSKINGNGIFANQDIKKGETIFIVKGEIKKYSDRTLPKNPQTGPNWLGIEKNAWLNIAKSPFRFINHSCSCRVGCAHHLT